MSFLPPVFLLALLLVAQNIVSPAKLSAADIDPASMKISRYDYGVFLNRNATSDPHHLYDWKMADGSWTILRSGAPGNYCYQAEGSRLETGDAEKNAPMFFLSCNDAAQYCSWKNNNDAHSSSLQSPASSLSIDDELHVSTVTFSIAAAEESTGAAAAIEILSGDEVGEWIGLAAIFFGGAAGEFAREANNPNEFRNEHEQVAPSMLHSAGPFCRASPMATFGNIPRDVIGKIASFYHTPEISNESGSFYEMQRKMYKKNYEDLLGNFETTRPGLHERLLTWQSAFDAEMGATADNFLDTHHKVTSIQRRLPLGGHAATAFYQAGAVMELFDELQKKLSEFLRNQKWQDTSILLASIARDHEQIDQATAQINLFLKIIETCQAKSALPSVQADSEIVNMYKDIAKNASDEIGTFINLFKITDAQKIDCLLKAREAKTKKLEYKLMEAEEMTAHGGIMTERARCFLKAADSAGEALLVFGYAADSASLPMKNIYQKEGQCLLFYAEELGTNGETLEAADWNIAAAYVKKARFCFQKNDFELGKSELSLGESLVKKASATRRAGVVKLEVLIAKHQSLIGSTQISDEAKREAMQRVEQMEKQKVFWRDQIFRWEAIFLDVAESFTASAAEQGNSG